MKYLFLLITMSATLLAYNYNFHGCALAPDNLNGWVVCNDTTLIIRTTNGGATWQFQYTDSLSFYDVTCLSGQNAWTAGVLAQILHTTNGGLNWAQQAFGISKYATRIEFLDANNGWATCGDGTIARTANGGSWWEQVFTVWYSAEYYGVSFISATTGWVVAGWPDSLALGQGMIIRSTDGGLGWDSLMQSSGYEDYVDVHFFSQSEGVVVGGNDQTKAAIILKTTNGGLSWNPITAPANAKYLRAVDFVGTKGWAVGNHGTIIYTTNNGNTWVAQTSPADSTLYDVDFSDNLHGLACGYDYILYTTNGGQNWLASGYALNVSVVPDNSSVPQGGQLGYTTTASNYTNSGVSIQYWVDIYLPNGQPYNGNPIFGPLQFGLGAYASRNRHFNLNIPMTAPLGTYALYTRVGTFPNTILDEDHFHFTVTTLDKMWGRFDSWQTDERGF